jgi:2-oxoglutarate dehydrogenase E2 component (dihydrolipoamide succinyltransferase)
MAGRNGVGVHLGGVIDRELVAARIAARDEPLAPVAAEPPPPAPPPDVEPYSAIRRRTAAHLSHSLEATAHALLVTEVDYGHLDPVRKRAGLTYLPYVARAVVEAVREFPRVNATSVEDGLRVARAVNLGIAVDLAHEGLVVPVVHGAGDLRLAALARRIDDVAGRARAGKLAVADLEGGTFTLTNVGSTGTVSAFPIINHPQVAILSTDGVRMRPVAVPTAEGEWSIAVRPVGNLSLAFDHRAFDGAYAAGFLARVRHELEHRDWEAE